MRLTHTDPDAPRFAAYVTRYGGRHPMPVPHCVLADEEAGIVEFVLIGPNAIVDDFGIGTDRPLPPADSLPYGHATGDLRGWVVLVPRGEEPAPESPARPSPPLAPQPDPPNPDTPPYPPRRPFERGEAPAKD